MTPGTASSSCWMTCEFLAGLNDLPHKTRINMACTAGYTRSLFLDGGDTRALNSGNEAEKSDTSDALWLLSLPQRRVRSSHPGPSTSGGVGRGQQRGETEARRGRVWRRSLYSELERAHPRLTTQSRRWPEKRLRTRRRPWRRHRAAAASAWCRPACRASSASGRDRSTSARRPARARRRLLAE